MKRLFDIVVSSFGLILLSPLLVAIAVAVAMSSRGPILFRQQRVGQFFHPFTLYKFRTMVVGSDSGPAVTAEGDSRVTAIGRVIRKTKLDELPQLINVLKGDMSLVGPRPEVARYVDLFRSDYEEILSVRPGITDQAAIAYRNEEELLSGYTDPEAGYVNVVLPAKIALYRRYIRERGMLGDLKILFATIWRVATG